jgi:hypothetical protein
VNENSAGLAREWLGEVLPLATLGRAGDDDDLRERRLIAVLRQSVGIDAVQPVGAQRAAASSVCGDTRKQLTGFTLLPTSARNDEAILWRVNQCG